MAQLEAELLDNFNPIIGLIFIKTKEEVMKAYHEFQSHYRSDFYHIKVTTKRGANSFQSHYRSDFYLIIGVGAVSGQHFNPIIGLIFILLLVRGIVVVR